MPDRGVQVPRLLGLLTEGHHEGDDAIAVRLPLLQHPVVVQVGEEIVVAQGQHRVAAPLGRETTDLPHIDPHVRAVLQPHAIATGEDMAGRLSSPSSRRSVADMVFRLARALVSQDVEQEHRGHARTGMQPRWYANHANSDRARRLAGGASLRRSRSRRSSPTRRTRSIVRQPNHT